MGLDAQLYHAIAGPSGNPVFDELMLIAGEGLIVLLPVVALVLWFRESTEPARRTAVLMTVTAGLSLVLSYIAAQLYSHPSPYMLYETVVQATETENAFPSQHAAVTFGAVWPALQDQDVRAYGLLLLGGAALTGFARIYIGEHFPLDIAGAIAVSLVAYGIVHLIDQETTLIRQTHDLCERVESRLEGFSPR